MRLKIIDDCFQLLGNPLVSVVQELFPYINADLRHVQADQLPFPDALLRHIVGKIGNARPFSSRRQISPVWPSSRKGSRVMERLARY